MVIITFSDAKTQASALGFLAKRFSGTVLKTGEVIIPESALAALAERNLEFTVKGKASYEHQTAAIRGAVASAV